MLHPVLLGPGEPGREKFYTNEKMGTLSFKGIFCCVTFINVCEIIMIGCRRHGQKGWRELQGESLRRHLTTCVQMEDDILAEMDELLADFRSQFPR